MRSKSEMLQELEAMLRDVFVARSTGVSYARMARAHGYVDGYMRAMLESGIATKQELLEIVASQRNSVDGPAVGEMHIDEIESAAA
jgi:hypothetical protein